MEPVLDLTVAAALFDMDGTLVDSTAVVERIWTDLAVEHGLDAGAVIAHTHGRQTRDSVAHLLPGADVSAITAALDAEELEALEGIVEVPGAADLMAALTGLPVAVVTSASRELATRRMRIAGVPVPDVVVAAEDVEAGKPAPDGYLAAARMLGVPVQHCVVFEDAEAGLQAAVASGASVVVVGRHESATTEGLPRVPDLRGVRVMPAADGGLRLVQAG